MAETGPEEVELGYPVCGFFLSPELELTTRGSEEKTTTLGTCVVELEMGDVIVDVAAKGDAGEE